jgi:spermidine/putrescine transport system ATP-binding protein
MTAPIDLEAREVVKSFGSFRAVHGVSFEIPKGSFFSILGPSGCGKTTLLRMIAGFLEPDSGQILIGGRAMAGIPPNRRPVNLIFQHLALFPMMTVAENIAYGLRRRGVGRPDIRERVERMLERIGLPGFGDKRIDQLSGGQKQRIAIARCLVLDPTVLLLDEPLGALDLKLREQMKVELKLLQADIGTTFVYITHDQSEALVMSDRVAVMNQGRFEQVDTPQGLYYRPRTAFVAGFVGESNRWQGSIISMSGDEARVRTREGLELTARTSEGLVTGQSVDLFVRPEGITLSKNPVEVGGLANRLAGTVESVLFDGANSRVLVKEARTGGEVTAALPQTDRFADLGPGQSLHLGWSAGGGLCFGRTA